MGLAAGRGRSAWRRGPCGGLWSRPGALGRSAAVARGAINFSARAASTHPVLVDGAVGLAWFRDGQLAAVLDFVCYGGKIVEIEIIGDPERLGHLALTDLQGVRIAVPD